MPLGMHCRISAGSSRRRDFKPWKKTGSSLSGNGSFGLELGIRAGVLPVQVCLCSTQEGRIFICGGFVAINGY